MIRRYHACATVAGLVLWISAGHLVAQSPGAAPQLVAITPDQKAIEHAAASQLRKEFASGHSGRLIVGLVLPSDNATEHFVNRPRAHADSVAATLGAQTVDSLAVVQCQHFRRSSVCQLRGLDALVRLHPPVVLRDSATVRVEIIHQSDRDPGHGLSIIGRTLTFTRHGAAWIYSGDRGPLIRT